MFCFIAKVLLIRCMHQLVWKDYEQNTCIRFTVFLLSDPGLDGPPSNVFVLSYKNTQVRKCLLHLWIFVQDVDFLLGPLSVGCIFLCVFFLDDLGKIKSDLSTLRALANCLLIVSEGMFPLTLYQIIQIPFCSGIIQYSVYLDLERLLLYTGAYQPQPSNV